MLQCHAHDDQKLALTGIPLLPIHEPHCFVSSLSVCLSVSVCLPVSLSAYLE